MIEPSPKNDALYDRLIGLKPAGLSTRAWTINAGVSSSFFDHVAAGGTPRDGELPKVLAVVGMTLAEFEGRRRTREPAPAAPPTLRVMPRAPTLSEAPAPQDSTETPTESAEAGPASDEETEAPVIPAPAFVEATAQAIERWHEARRQADAAGLDTDGVEGARLVSELARLAFEIERSQAGALVTDAA